MPGTLRCVVCVLLASLAASVVFGQDAAPQLSAPLNGEHSTTTESVTAPVPEALPAPATATVPAAPHPIDDTPATTPAPATTSTATSAETKVMTEITEALDELTKRGAWLVKWAAMERHGGVLANPEDRRYLEIIKGEVHVLARRAMQIPPEDMNDIDYELRNEADGRIRLYLKRHSTGKDFGSIGYEADGKYIGAQFDKEWASWLVNNVPTITLQERAKKELIQFSPTFFNKQMTDTMQEGEIEFIAKEYFNVANKDGELNTSIIDGRQYGHNSTFVRFNDKKTQAEIGAAGFHYGVNGVKRNQLVYWNSVGPDGTVQDLFDDLKAKIQRRELP